MNKLLLILALIVFSITGCTSLPEQIGPRLTGTYKKGDSELILNGETSPYEYIYKENGVNRSRGFIAVQEQNKIKVNEHYRWIGNEWEARAPITVIFEYIHIAAGGQLMLRNGSDLKFIEGMWRIDETAGAQSSNSGTQRAETNTQTAQTGGETNLNPQGENVSYLQIIGTTRVVRINEQTVNWGADVGLFGLYASNNSIVTVKIPSGRHTLRIRGSNWDNNQKHDTIEYDFEPGQTYIVKIRQYPGHGGYIYNIATGEGDEKRYVTLLPMVAVSYFPLNIFNFSSDYVIDSNWATMYSLGLSLFDRISLTFGAQLDDPIIGKLSKLAGSINSKLFGLKFDYQTIKGHLEKTPDTKFEIDSTMLTLFYLWDLGVHNMPLEIGLFWKNSSIPPALDVKGEENHYGLYVGVDANGVEHNKDFLFWRMEAGLALTYQYAQTQIGWGHDQYFGKKNAMTMYVGADFKIESWTGMYTVWSLGPVLKLRVGF